MRCLPKKAVAGALKKVIAVTNTPEDENALNRLRRISDLICAGSRIEGVKWGGQHEKCSPGIIALHVDAVAAAAVGPAVVVPPGDLHGDLARPDPLEYRDGLGVRQARRRVAVHR